MPVQCPSLLLGYWYTGGARTRRSPFCGLGLRGKLGSPPRVGHVLAFEHPVDHIMGSPLSDADKVAILSENAAKLFGIKTNGAG